MSKDIRSYFKIGGGVGEVSKTKNTSTSKESSNTKRKALRISSSDEEKILPVTPKQKSNSSTSAKKSSLKTLSKKRRVVIESDDEDASHDRKKIDKRPNLLQITKQPNKNELKRVDDISSILGGVPIRVDKKKPPSLVSDQKNEKPTEDLILLSDDDFEKSVIDFDENTLVASAKIKTPEKRKLNDAGSTSKSVDGNSPKKLKLKSPEKLNIFPKTPKADKPVKVNNTNFDEDFISVASKNKSKSKDDLDSSVLSDEDRHERKRMAAILYQKFKHRQGALNPGSKEVPKGKPNCLAGLTFLVSGVLESLEREEANNLIKDFGGKISTVVGKKLQYVIVGEEAGPKKLAQAEEFGTKILNEDELFDLIRERSGELKKQDARNDQTVPLKKMKTENHSSPVKEAKTKSPKESEVVKTVENTRETTQYEKDIKSIENQAWVDKYKPSTVKEIIGQQGAASNCAKLMKWLSNWYSNHDGKKKLTRPSPWSKNDDGSYYRAALLSGPPGVGKTTTANLVCKELGFTAVEFNASDTRSKRLLKEEVSSLLSNNSLFDYAHGESKSVSKKHVLIMDEVDGMAGNEDRGGMQELISLIKESSVPVICMCNDRNHPKIRSLVNYCHDLRFNRPRSEQIKGFVMSICFKEKLKLPTAKIEEIISASNNDIRQTLNHLSLLSAGKELKLDESALSKTAGKDLKLGPWEIVSKVFSEKEHKNMSINDFSSLFFHDYSLGPLFVQQNYLSVQPHVEKSKINHQVYLTADALSLGDLIDKRIRSNNAWSLLPVQAIFSCVMPGKYMSGHLTGQINFPGWLGKNSNRTKRSRLAQELHNHTRIKTSGSRLSIRLDYAPFLLDAIVRPLRENGTDGVHQALNVMKEYHLLREDIESLIELTKWPRKKNPMDGVDSKVKASLTRAYNKEVLAYSYSVTAGVKKKRAESVDDTTELLDAEADAIVSDEDDDDDKLENDALIKATKKSTAKNSASTASTSKETNNKRGNVSARTKVGTKARK